MNILLSFLQDNRAVPHPVPAYRFWSYYIKNGIKESEMTWIEVPGLDWAEGLLYDEKSFEIKEWKDRVWDSTLEFIKRNRDKIDIFLSYLYPKQVDVDSITEIRKLGIPCVNFYCDSVREFLTVPVQFKAFDLIWVPEYEAIPLYKKANVNFIHLPMPMWVETTQRRQVFPNEKAPVTFIGSKDILREKLLSDAIKKGLPVEIWGPGWMDSTENHHSPQFRSGSDTLRNQINFVKSRGWAGLFMKYLQKINKVSCAPIDISYLNTVPSAIQYSNLIQDSKVTLGINRVPSLKRLHSSPLVYSRLRDIEAPMLGACYLTEYCHGLDFMYEIGTDIYVYRDVDELIDKTNELLKDGIKRRKLRLNGRQRALNELSIPPSLKKLRDSLFK